MAETPLSKSVHLTAEQQYDAQVKVLLANKEILAWIMKDCVEEYKNCSVEDIAYKYIEGTPEIDTPVDREDAAPNIQGLSNEDTTAAEGKVLYDIRFNAIAPDDEGQYIKLIINIEAQQKDDPGYSLTRRGIYYCSRMLSAEKNVEFVKSDYNRLKKVYSIWICYSSTKAPNTMVRFKMAKEELVGHVNVHPKEYDLLQVIMLRLGDPEEAGAKSALRMLDYIFTNEIAIEQRKQALEGEYDLAMTEKVREEMNQMCNVSQGILEQGIQKGLEKGLEKGLKETAFRLQKMGTSLPMIAAIVNMPESTVAEWLRQ